MVSNKTKETGESFICWLCGQVQHSTGDFRAMRDVECPNCKLKSAFLPRPTGGA
jgi:DNA-directed RNA polymerase subunit RPC12/RpoP